MATIGLRELLAGIVAVPAADDRPIHGVQLDSRAVAANDLFIALPGSRRDAGDYMNDAVARGAVALVYQADRPATERFPVPAYALADPRVHLGAIADRCYGAPSRRLVVIGVTGTNGKTTCTQLLAQALDNTESRAARSARPLPPLAGEGVGMGVSPSSRTGELEEGWHDRGRNDGDGSTRCAVIGTLGYGFPDALATGVHTTPDCATVHRLLARFADAGARYTAMEVSSHALDQGRIDNVRVALAVYTNLSRDHLDYHGDMDAYGRVKMRLFDRDELDGAIINRDDDFGRQLIDHIGNRYPVWTYGLRAGDVHARAIETTRTGLRVQVVTPRGEVNITAPLFGEFNVLNLLAVLAVLLKLDLSLDEAARRLRAVRPVPGRAERFGGRAGTPLVMVDYAHSPDALEKILRALRLHTRGQLWCVFGCGGNRDRGKRPQMGAIAERLADVVIVTDDNPREESGDAIVADIVAGMRVAPRVIRDRADAIARAIHAAATDDSVLIAGKGHEDYQEVSGVRTPYSDRDTVRALLGEAA